MEWKTKWIPPLWEEMEGTNSIKEQKFLDNDAKKATKEQIMMHQNWTVYLLLGGNEGNKIEVNIKNDYSFN